MLMIDCMQLLRCRLSSVAREPRVFDAMEYVSDLWIPCRDLEGPLTSSAAGATSKTGSTMSNLSLSLIYSLIASISTSLPHECVT